MNLPELKIGKLVAQVPIVQGGMAIRLSTAPLAAAVANEGGIGLIATKFKSNMSRLVALTIVEEKDEIMLVTSSGIVTRIKAGDISCQGRPATGVRAQNLMDNDTVVSVNKIVNTDKDDDEVDPLIGSGEILKAAEEAEAAGEQTSLLGETTEE